MSINTTFSSFQNNGRPPSWTFGFLKVRNLNCREIKHMGHVILTTPIKGHFVIPKLTLDIA